MSDNISSVAYDDQLKTLIGSELSWLPYVGKNYHSSKYKILVVGESHYAEEQHKDAWRDVNSTRDCIDEVMYRNLWQNRTFSNITYLLKGQRYNDPALWDHIAYHNFVQELMITRQERPSNYYSPWESFLSVVNVLKPDQVIFIGVTAANCFDKYMNDQDMEYTPIEYADAISNVQPRIGSVRINRYDMPLMFVKHCGMRFSVNKWGHFLDERIPDQMNFLKGLDLNTLSVAQKNEILTQVFIPQLHQLATQLGLTYVDSAFDIKSEPVGFMFSNPKWNDFMLGFEFWHPNLKGLTYGFYTEKKWDERLYLLRKNGEGKIYQKWLYYEAYSYYNWYDYAFEAIKNGQMIEFFRICLCDYLLKNVDKAIKL